jgi:hypothetical protein
MRKLVFDQVGDFAASREAEAWCAKHGYAVGAAEEGRARGIRKGDAPLGTWTGLRQCDKDALDGRMTGDMRTGPVLVELNG